MYKTLLILKYLRKRRIAWVSLVAVMLCTAMVLVVISVMGGWLRMFRASFQGLSGDVVVRADSRTGFPHYERMIAEIEALPEAVAAVPMIHTFGLINIDNAVRDGVNVVGLPLADIGRINAFHESLYLKNPKSSPAEPLADYRAGIERELGEYLKRVDAEERARIADDYLMPVREWAESKKAGGTPTFDLPFNPQFYREKLDVGRRGRNAPDAATYPGMIVGTGVAGIHKGEQGDINRWIGLEPENPRPVDLLTIQLRDDIAFTIDETTKAERTFFIVDNSRTGVFQTDEETVYIDFALLQQMVGMTAQEQFAEIDPATGQGVGEPIIDPARTGEVHVKLAAGVDLIEGRRAVQRVVDRVRFEADIDPRIGISVQTWEQRYSSFLQAVEREKVLMTVLFGMISMVAVFLILCIFYMIVQEKIRDIGIVKSVGATSGGVALIFLGYGAAVGIVGGILGAVVGGLFVWYINPIHDLIGRVLGVQIYTAQTYMFDKIPNTMNPVEVVVIVGVAILSSVVGAVVPAWRAASLRPVEALRFE